MKKPSLAIAYNIKKHAQKKACGGAVKMSEGGEVEPIFGHKDLAHAVMKKLSGSDLHQEDDSFLSADEQTPLPDVGMPDDSDERMEAMSNEAEDDSHRGILHGIMNKIHRKHKG